MSVFVEEYASWDDDDAVDAVPLGICPACTKEVELDPNPQAPPQWICSECGAAVPDAPFEEDAFPSPSLITW